MTQHDTDVNGKWRSAVAAKDVANDEVVGCRVGEREIAIYRIEGALYATSNVCTHALAMLSDGIVENCTIECPLHNGRFDIKTGKALTSPV
jgi:naphthalene 1,2-dioxygenase ferredoxin component